MKKKMIFGILILAAIVIAGVIIYAAKLGKEVEIKTDKRLSGVDEEIQEVLYYASLAPNSHNAQMWKLQLHPSINELYIGLDNKRLLKVVDEENREAYLSIGCYIANLQAAFNAYGFEMELSIFEKPDTNGNIAKVVYKKTNNTVDKKVLNTLEKRHTDKTAYQDKILSQSTVERLEGEDTVCFPKETEGFAYLQKETLEAVTKQSAEERFRDELAEWMRFSDKEVIEKQDGISAEQMGLKGIVKTLYYWTADRQSAKGDKFAQQGIDTAKKQVENCAAFLVVTGEDNMIGWINAGIHTERLWIKCVELGISVHPMSAVLETSPFAEALQKDLNLKKTAQMILRVGYVNDYGKNTGNRRDLNTYITTK
ncbi:Acg family FMN-binding oxidoreductase [Anaerosacchariphilus polymeriproducens]|uniref:Uncharacterized protein n=1 Tax=Anaerosacchariphilus polymeriproducens TaxID=1812858 RepID=A0A371AX56_9FIRM|nr:nitroreductase family protein [Anaerosacchariphilus polymeriproducens]RDU24164.1 hypothetical protein DWV06_05545 [Anaerosacchariphilus polymeriproducens]